jgi:threonyl-tRNA synthetase
MRILLLHVDQIEYEARERIKGISEDIEEDERKRRVDEALVTFLACEKGDNESCVESCVREIGEVFNKVKAEKIVVYPYAHLSSNLLDPKNAKRLTEEVANELKTRGYSTDRAPFGWYKSFSLSCKGHPLSELSKTIVPVEKAKTREEIIGKVKSRCVVLTPENEEIEMEMKKGVEEVDKIGDESLRSFILSGELGIVKGESSSFKEMQRLQVVDYEPASDSGHFRFYPNGALIFDLLTSFCRKVAKDSEAVEIDTPLIYNWAEPDIRAQTESFHERHYIVKGGESEKEFVLRFAGDFGLFKMLKESVISYKHLPFKVYELTKSFRYEQSGELSGFKRLRAFHMPDLHAFARDVDEGWDLFEEIFKEHVAIMDGLDIEYAIAFRVVEEFYTKYKDKIAELLRYANKSGFIEVLSERTHYWVIKDEFQEIDSIGDSIQLCTVQLDVEDGERYGIDYTDEDGKKKYCTIVHSSVGAIERLIHSVFEDALKKKPHELKFWLAPTQLRIIPVSREHVEDCMLLQKKIGGRADIDDREESVSRKIRDAGREWISMVLVYGKKEKGAEKYPVRLRNGEQREMSIDDINRYIKERVEGYPSGSLAMPVLLSKRPIFRG